MAKRIAAEWKSYREDVMAGDAPPIQVQECRRAFYAGAQAFLSLLMSKLEPDAEPTEADLQMMDEIHEELQQFARAVAAGVR